MVSIRFTHTSPSQIVPVMAFQFPGNFGVSVSAPVIANRPLDKFPQRRPFLKRHLSYQIPNTELPLTWDESPRYPLRNSKGGRGDPFCFDW